jgi:hypothetical protein
LEALKDVERGQRKRAKRRDTECAEIRRRRNSGRFGRKGGAWAKHSEW